MNEKMKWNERYKAMNREKRRGSIHPILKQFFTLAQGMRALDIACGKGENALFLAENGFYVDAVDISDQALSLFEHPNISKFCLDIKEFTFDKYDLIFCSNFLERSIFQNILNALKPNGIVIYSTFHYKSSINLKYALMKNELLDVFLELEILYYKIGEEKADIVAQRTAIPSQKNSTCFSKIVAN